MSVELLPHNQETYETMIEMFKTDNRIAVVQPTGTGKSFLILKWIEDHPDENILILSPSNVIFSQLEKYAEDCDVYMSNVEECTYQRLNISDIDDIADIKASKIVLDEFHRTGAEKWCENIDVLLDSHEDSQILGLTATPIRYLDRSRNMATEIFNDNLARYMDLGEAIVDGILPIPKYIPVWYDYDDKLTEYQKNINNLKTAKERKEAEKLLKEMRNNLQKSYGVEIMFKEHMPNNHGKYIVFCRDNTQLLIMQDMMKYWLSYINTNIHFYTTVHYMYDKDKQVQEFIDDTDDTSIRLLFSINRLNEGLHVPGIDGVILTRPTESPIIYLQQIGRVFDTNGNEPLIFDLVNNYKNVKAVGPEGTFVNILEHSIRSIALSRGIDYDCPIFGIFEEAKTFNEIYNEFEQRLSMYIVPWNNNFELLKEFKEKFNRLPKYIESYKEVNLGIWLHNQKQIFKENKLSKEKQELLESVGVDLVIYKMPKWNTKFELLKEFKEKFNRLPKRRESYKEVNLGNWIDGQKRAFKEGKLSKERQELFESIGVDFTIEYTSEWNTKFELLKEFKEKFNRLPKQRESYKEVNLGTWIAIQKQVFRKGKLSKEKQELLESIGVDLIIHSIPEWNTKFELLKEFKEKFNRLPKQIESYKEVNLGTWIGVQKRAFNDGKLSKEMQQKLESIGVDLIIHSIPEWNTKFELLKEFKEKFNRLPKQIESYKEVNLGFWVSNQIKIFRKGKLSKERQELLESIGVDFTRKITYISWNTKFELLKEFKEKFNRLPKRRESYKEVNLGNWIGGQKRAFNDGKLSKEKQELLESVGVIF